jgi:hypothetical protein
VKICTLYGDGFYYIPGTDICLKIGGYVRAEVGYHYGNSLTNGPFSNVNGFQTRTDGQDYTIRTRAYIWEDSRQQTEYGTLRTYFQLGVNYDNPQASSTNFNANRAFIQFAGFTLGTAQSFYDFFNAAATSFWANVFSSDTGDPGWKVIAYTQQFGNGISGSVSLEEPRRSVVWDTNTGTTATLIGNSWVVGTLPTADQAKTRFPDLVNNWRIDQAWGAAQIMFAAHDASAGYYQNTPVGVVPLNCTPAAAGALTGSEVCGHPADRLGWAVGAGAKLNTFGGSYFQIQGNYAQGATRYVLFTPGGAYSPTQFNGNTVGYGILTDAVYSNGTGEVELTTAWGVNAAYEHFWRPDLRTSLYGSYAQVKYNDAANTAICISQTTPNLTGGTISFIGTATLPASGPGTCNNNFNWWAVGSRTQWNITPWFYVGFDVVYQKLETASAGATVYYTQLANTAKPQNIYRVTDQDNWAFRVRAHRDIVP